MSRPFFRCARPAPRRCAGVVRALLSFACLSVACFAVGASPADAARADDAPALVAIGARDATGIALIECRSGRPLALATPPAPLAAEPVFAPDGKSLYALAGAQLLRYQLPELRELARVTLGYAPTALAAAGGDDAVVMAGGHGLAALSAHDPVTLAEVQRYRLPEPFSISALHDAPARRRFVVAFADLAEAWEIAYGRDAPPVLQGLVHDYRSGEAVPLPGRFTPRRFELPSATRALVAGAVPYEVARLDQAGAFGVVHLDVRREIERPVTATEPVPDRIVTWRGAARRGWLIAGDGAMDAEVLEAGAWRVTGRLAVDGAILALGAAGNRVLVAHQRADGVAVSLVDVSRGTVEPLATRIAPTRPPLQFSAGTGGCVALLERGQRWLAGFAVPPLR